jgi:hypothetical protein
MKQSDAAKILGLNGQVNPEMITKAFRSQAKKYHPDVNPEAGEKMMKLINEAYSDLKGFTGELSQSENETDSFENFTEEMNNILNIICALVGLDIEICGSWVWVGGDTRTHKDVLKEQGFKWANQKKKWSLRPKDWKKQSRGKMSMDDIRNAHGSMTVRKTKRYLGAA